MKLRKGFTLVELLIVIVIIGVLAAAMLLASGAATASAEASNIVSNLRNLQSGSLMFFADNMDDLMAGNPAVVLYDDPRTAGAQIDITVAADAVHLLVQYTNNPDAGVWDNYMFEVVGGAATTPIADRTWYVSSLVTRRDVSTRLEGRADGVGLFEDALVIPGAPYSAPTATPFPTGHRVYMLIRNPGA